MKILHSPCDYESPMVTTVACSCDGILCMSDKYFGGSAIEDVDRTEEFEW